ncbi:hypothetical protein ABPG75_000555 [Micractinium tetrahymenae]
MPLRYVGKAKQHVFLDVGIEECLKSTPAYEVKAGAGTKLVITVGPSCQDVATLAKLLQAGVTCARVDLSWGTKEYHARSLANLAEAMLQTRRLCSVWLDTTGREVVVRRPVEYDASGWPRQVDDKMTVQKEQEVVITTDPTIECGPNLLPVNYPGFPDIVDVGQTLQVGRYLATGSEGVSLYLEVVDIEDDKVICRATNSATLDGLLTVMVCHTCDEDFRADFALPLLTEHDVECMRFLGSQFEVDFISLSYCNAATDLYSCRALLDSLGMQQTKIIAKIERKAAVRNFEPIAHVADGIIISRGNLGLDFDAEVMALLQKRIISRCNQLGKPVLITRIVDTMITTPRPTRAEATDVANAVLDGVDGLLLGAETLRGRYPVDTADTVLKLCHSAEQHFDYRTHHETLMGEAYEEEVSLGRADVSVSDFRMYLGEGSPTTTLARGGARRSRFFKARSFGANLLGARSSTSEDGGPYGGAGGGGGREANGAAGGGGAGSPHVGFQVGGATPAPPLACPTALAGIGTGPAVGAELAAQGISQAAQGGQVTPGPSSPGFQPPASPPDGPPSADRGGLMGELSASSSAPAPALPPQPHISMFGSLPPTLSGSSPQLQAILATHAPYMSKLESIASSATRTAEKINAGLIMVMVQTGRTVSLVAKYRPPMPILAVVVPQLKATQLGWRLEGKFLARQALALRGVVPMMAAPMSDTGEDLLSEAVHSAFLQRLVRPNDYVVCIMSHRGSMVVKVVQVNRIGAGLKTMSGLNSGGIGSESPDIISERSPFGAYMPPHSPMVRSGVPPSPSRTLSGRPSPLSMAPPPLSLGGGFGPTPSGPIAPVVGAGRGGGHYLLSTASEAQYLDDRTAAALAAELAVAREAREAGSARSSAGGSPLGSGAAAGGRGLRISLESPTSPSADGAADGRASVGSGGSGLSPIREGVPADSLPAGRASSLPGQQS